MGVELGGATTYKTLEPGPYWPDNGQAQTTCRASLAVLVFTESDDEEKSTLPRSCRVFRAEAEKSAGMASRASHQNNPVFEAKIREVEWGQFKSAAHVRWKLFSLPTRCIMKSSKEFLR